MEMGTIRNKLGFRLTTGFEKREKLSGADLTVSK